MSSIAVAIIFFEKLDQTIDCVKSVLNDGCNIYILNNGSSHYSFNKLKTAFKERLNVIFIDSSENLGPSRGRNLLIGTIKEPWIFFLDNDITVKTPEWSKLAQAHINQNPTIEVFIPRLYNVHEENWQEYHSYDLQDSVVLGIKPLKMMVNCFPGGGAIVQKKLYQRLGLYSDKITVLEDFEFCIRGLMTMDPIRCLLVADIELFHDHRYSKSARDKEAVKIRYASHQFQHAENYIREKYKIDYWSGWQPWVSLQVDTMLFNTKWKKFLRKSRSYIQRISAKYLGGK